MKNILVINCNPARERKTLDASLAAAYAKGAKNSGYSVKEVSLATLKFAPILHEGYSKDQELEPDLQMLRDSMVEAEHWVLVFSIWLGLPPALVKGFLERILTRGFAFEFNGNRPAALPALKGKSVHIIITCGMPSFVYSWLSGQPTSKALRTIFKLCGMSVTGVSVFGSVAEHTPEALKRYGHYITTSQQLGKIAK